MDMTTGCIKVRQTLEALLRARGEQKAAKYRFRAEEQVLATDVFFRIEVDLNPRQLMLASTDAKARATKNLEAFELFENERCLASAPSFKISLFWCHHEPRVGPGLPLVKPGQQDIRRGCTRWTRCGSMELKWEMFQPYSMTPEG